MVYRFQTKMKKTSFTGITLRTFTLLCKLNYVGYIIIFMERFILDTNLFFNMESGLQLGQKTEEVIVSLTHLMQSLKSQKKAEFLMPPRVVEEMLGFFEDREQPFLKTFLSQITIKSPAIDALQIPAAVFQTFVEENRTRSYRGLNIAEEEIIKAGQLLLGKSELGKKEFEMTVGPIIKNFRERYRAATRFGFIDSLADLDLLLLVKETNGYLVSTDEGVIRWGRIIGLKEMAAAVFAQKLANLQAKAG